MPIDKSRIQGFGSDGSKEKIWKCPEGHSLQPWKAKAGRCDGCMQRVCENDPVMDCRQCNWYLCTNCHPQEAESQDWFWGSLSSWVEAVQTEVAEIQEDINEAANEFQNMVSDIGFSATCGAATSSQLTQEEIKFEDEDAGGQKADGKRKGSKKEGDESGADEQKAEERAAAEDGDDSSRPRTPRAASKAGASKAGSDAEETEAPEPSPSSAVVEDLLDIGQNDLIKFFDDEPERANEAAADKVAPDVKKGEALDLFDDFVPPARADPAPAAELSRNAQAPVDLLFEPSSAPAAAPVIAPLAPEVIAPLAPPPKAGAPATAADPLDLLFEPSSAGAAAPTPPQVGPAATATNELPLDLLIGAPAGPTEAVPKSCANELGGVSLIDLSDAPQRVA